MTDERASEERALDGLEPGELDCRLRTAGAMPTLAPDDLTVARIERRLRDQHGARRRPRVLAPVLAGVAAALVVVALANAGSEPQAIGTAGTGRDSGAPIVTVAPTPDDDTDTDTGSSEDTDRRGGSPDNDDDPVDATLPNRPSGPNTDDDDDQRATTTTAPPPAPGDNSARPADGPRTTTTQPAPTDTRPTSTTSTTEPAEREPAPSRIDARVRVRGTQAVIGWTEYAGDDLVRWSVLRYTEPPDGSLAPAKEELVLRDGAPGDRQFVDEPPARGQVSYVVRGHRRDGAVVARSPRVALER